MEAISRVAYFSRADNAVLAEDVDAVASPSVISPGNVQQLAGWVQEETGGDLFSIRVTDPYPSDWDDCLARANEERGADARPELVENAENLEQYDTVFLGYPNWWYGVPMALLSFWSRMICPESRYTCSAPTEPEAWRTAWSSSRRRLLPQRSQTTSLTAMKRKLLPRRRKFAAGSENWALAGMKAVQIPQISRRNERYPKGGE